MHRETTTQSPLWAAGSTPHCARCGLAMSHDGYDPNGGWVWRCSNPQHGWESLAEASVSVSDQIDALLNALPPLPPAHTRTRGWAAQYQMRCGGCGRFATLARDGGEHVYICKRCGEYVQ